MPVLYVSQYWISSGHSSLSCDHWHLATYYSVQLSNSDWMDIIWLTRLGRSTMLVIGSRKMMAQQLLTVVSQRPTFVFSGRSISKCFDIKFWAFTVSLYSFGAKFSPSTVEYELPKVCMSEKVYNSVFKHHINTINTEHGCQSKSESSMFFVCR